MMTPKERAAVSIQNESETISSLSMMRTAMQQALKAMKDASPYGLTFKEAIIACEEALEQPDEIDWIETNKSLAKEIIELKKQAEQEPMYISKYCVKSGCACHYSTAVDGEPVAVYTRPIRTKDLTDDELREVLDKHCGDGLMPLSRAVIAADREKNNV